MNRKFNTDKEYRSLDFSSEALEMADYENCRFIQCNFALSDLSERQFEDCSFDECDLSNANITHTAFRTVSFESCKLIGLQFDTCNPFLLAMKFKKSILNFSSFFQLKLPGTVFSQCSIQEADFSNANFNGATFHECDLIGSMFDNTQLEKADFYTATQFIIDPEKNKISEARFSYENIEGLLTKYNIVLER